MPLVIFIAEPSFLPADVAASSQAGNVVAKTLFAGRQRRLDATFNSLRPPRLVSGCRGMPHNLVLDGRHLDEPHQLHAMDALLCDLEVVRRDLRELLRAPSRLRLDPTGRTNSLHEMQVVRLFGQTNRPAPSASQEPASELACASARPRRPERSAVSVRS